jgi:phosphoglucomutase
MEAGFSRMNDLTVIQASQVKLLISESFLLLYLFIIYSKL